MIKVTTATSGQTLRAYADGKRNDGRVAIFPEAGLDANEQAAWLADHGDNFDEVITLSAFIISDAPTEQIHVIDKPNHELVHGQSVVKVTMRLWRSSTIGDRAKSTLTAFHERISAEADPDKADRLINAIDKAVGDSVERSMLLATITSNREQG